MTPAGAHIATQFVGMGPFWGAFTAALGSGLFWGLVLAAAGLWMMLPGSGRRLWLLGVLFAAVGFVLLAVQVPALAGWTRQTGFWIVAGSTVAAAAFTITMRSPVYCAVWFAITLLGTAVLYLFSGAQFLAAATIIVYAGAIVVTILFVLMLAQPQGQAEYDRIGWGDVPGFASVIAGLGIVAVLTASTSALEPSLQDRVKAAISALNEKPSDNTSADGTTRASDEDTERLETPAVKASDVRGAKMVRHQDGPHVLQVELAVTAPLPEGQAKDRLVAALKIRSGTPATPSPAKIEFVHRDVRAPQHMARVGRELFGSHLISIQVAGTLLLVAVVAAAAIISRAGGTRESSASQQGADEPFSGNGRAAT